MGRKAENLKELTEGATHQEWEPAGLILTQHGEKLHQVPRHSKGIGQIESSFLISMGGGAMARFLVGGVICPG